MRIHHKTPYRTERVRAARDKELRQGIEWAGHVFQIDPDSQRLISGRVAAIHAKGVENCSAFAWRTISNTDYEFQPQEFLDFAVAVDARVDEIYRTSWSL